MSYAIAKRLYLNSKRLRRKRDEYEQLYMIFSKDVQAEPTELGSEQFYRYESFGETPENPDPFHFRLCQGKKWFSVQQEMIRSTFLTFEWDGWYSYWLDWKGERWALKYLMEWHPNPPEWLCKEEDMPDDIHDTDTIKFAPEPPEELNPPQCEWCQDRKIIYGESEHRPQGETCPMCK